MKVLAAAIAVLVATQPSRVDPVLELLDRYLEAYEPRLSELIADELMLQDGQSQEGRRVRRRLASEVAFIALPEGAGWLGFRHVKAMDGRRVDAGDASLGRALASSVTSDAARRLLEDSARHNLGLARTTNLPNLPLEFLHKRNRRRFVVRWDGSERVRAISTTRLALLERITPTLIRSPDGSDMRSVVKAWIDPDTGQLLRAEVRSLAPLGHDTTNIIRVDFATNATLGLLVPIEMQEVFPVGPNREGRSVARYSNYRRFQTSARIVPQ
jgi:hypothetical protein